MNEDDSREGVFYYALKDEKLQLLHKTLATRQACKEHDPD
jgi:hypothetical protein